jgi:hypothetical protein
MIKKNVKSEFGLPCAREYQKALSAMKFLSRYHSKEALFKQLRIDVLGNSNNKFLGNKK